MGIHKDFVFISACITKKWKLADKTNILIKNYMKTWTVKLNVLHFNPHVLHSELCFLLNTHLTYSSIFLLSVTRRPVSCQLHGQAKIDDDTRAVSFDKNISAVQVSVGNGGFVQVWMEEKGEERGGGVGWQREDQEKTQDKRTGLIYFSLKI